MSCTCTGMMQTLRGITRPVLVGPHSSNDAWSLQNQNPALPLRHTGFGVYTVAMALAPRCEAANWIAIESCNLLNDWHRAMNPGVQATPKQWALSRLAD